LAIKAVIFDYNGTLIDDRHLGYLSLKKIFRIYGVPCPSEKVFGEGITEDFPNFYFKHGIDRSVSLQKLNEIRIEYYLKNWHKILLRPTSLATINYCRDRNLKVGLVSGERSVLLDPKIKEWGIDHLFDFIRAQAWPKVEHLNKAIELFGVKPEESVYVDDTVEGILEAKSVGMNTVAMGSGFCPARKILERAKPDHMIYETYELAKWLNEYGI
jgi:phosphoglycolate phosphatase-like HAD superfamily hydrolase